MKKIKKVNELKGFKELSKKEKQKTTGGGLMISTAFLREIIPYLMP